MTLDINQDDDGVVSALGYRTRACTLGMASLAIVVENAVGTHVDEILRIEMLVSDILLGKDAHLEKKWDDLTVFAAARAFPRRHGSILLPFQAFQKAGALAVPH